jgi:ribonuclease HI
MNSYICYTDGSCIKNTKGYGNGGWASVILNDKGNIIKELYNGFQYTTNNRMELTAVLETLKYFKEPSKIKIISDSMYVVNSITQHWAEKWFENEDYSKENLDLWIQVLELLKVHKVEVEWVKGHACSKWNNRADELAQFAATFINLPEDEYYLKSKKDRKPLVS